MAFKFSEELKIMPKKYSSKNRKPPEIFGIPANVKDIDFEFDPEILLKAMLADKKNRNGNIVLILASDIGKSYVARNINHNSVEQFLNNIYN